MGTCDVEGIGFVDPVVQPGGELVEARKLVQYDKIKGAFRSYLGNAIEVQRNLSTLTLVDDVAQCPNVRMRGLGRYQDLLLAVDYLKEHIASIIHRGAFACQWEHTDPVIFYTDFFSIQDEFH